MQTMLRQAAILLALLSLLTGLLYPLGITGLARWMCPHTAGGSLAVIQGTTVGSELLAQPFTGSRYFHPRPSAGDFAAVPSKASNFGPTSRALRDVIAARAQGLRHENHLPATAQVPPDLLMTSASGLDPHISPEAARLQLARVSAARAFTAEQRDRLDALVRACTEPPLGGILGEPRVNVLLLNLAVDRLTEPGPSPASDMP